MASLMLSSKLLLSPFTNSESRCFSTNISHLNAKAPQISSLKMSIKFSPFPELDSRVLDLHHSLRPATITIGTVFLSPDHRILHESNHSGAAVCIDPTLVLTSAHVVARAVAPQKKAYVGSTVGRTVVGEIPVQLSPWAINFACDVAVLKVKEAGNDLTPCRVARSPLERESLLISNSYSEEKGWGISAGNVRAVGRKTIPARAPWPMKDEAGWIEHDWMFFNRGPPTPGSGKVCGAVFKMSGSPWFNLSGELVGVASWFLRDKQGAFSVGYAAPLSNVLLLLHYAKTRRPSDPIVMDSWIEEVAVTDDHHAS